MIVDRPGEGLTESQKTCLRLVARGLTSKEIAAQTGWSPQTVDTYLKAAMARLGAGSRREAARQFINSAGSQRLGSPSEPIADAPLIAQPERAASTSEAGPLVPPPLGGRLNELTAGERTIAIIKVAALGAAVLVALTLVIAGVLQTFR